MALEINSGRPQRKKSGGLGGRIVEEGKRERRQIPRSLSSFVEKKKNINDGGGGQDQSPIGRGLRMGEPRGT